MKITKEKLQQLIREELEAYSKTVEEEVMTEDLGMVLSAAAGTVLGILGLGVGMKAYAKAKVAYANFKYENQKEAARIESMLRQELEDREAARIQNELMKDKDLLQLIDLYAELSEVVEDAKGKGIRTPEMAAFRKLAPKMSKLVTDKLNDKALQIMAQSPELKALAKSGYTQGNVMKRTKKSMRGMGRDARRAGMDGTLELDN